MNQLVNISLEDTRILLPGKSMSLLFLLIASLRYITAVCKLPLGVSLTLVPFSLEIKKRMLFVVFAPLNLFGTHIVLITPLWRLFTSNLSLLFSDCIVGNIVMEFALLFAETLTLMIAKNILLH